MEFTGERYLPQIHGNIELEHIHRYLQALTIATGKDVLDIASGEGYGSAMLAKKANKVIGVDISTEAINHARKQYQMDNLDFIVGNCSDIPLPDASIDLVVTFETIEHIDQHDQMMKEIKRVLRPSGILLISSPDKYFYSVEPGYNNPFHKKELYDFEFKNLLNTFFSKTNFYGQRIVYGSNIISESKQTKTISYFQENEIIKNSLGVTKPTYWIGLASDDQLPDLFSSIFEQPINKSEIIQSWSALLSERDQIVQKLSTQIEIYEQTIQSLTTQVAEREQVIQSLTSQVTEREQSIWNLTSKYNHAIKELDEIKIEIANYALSTSWRITRPLRKFKDFLWKLKNV